MPAGAEFTLRANTPLRTPTTIPLNPAPIRMPASPGRAAGGNHAVAPSRIPRIAPTTIPATGLFIARSSTLYSVPLKNPLATEEKNQRELYHEIGCQQK